MTQDINPDSVEVAPGEFKRLADCTPADHRALIAARAQMIQQRRARLIDREKLANIERTRSEKDGRKP